LETIVCALLRKESAAVRLYLEQGANASEKAAAQSIRQRGILLAMESKWMNLVAGTAIVERMDLFLQSREFRQRLLLSDLYPDCHARVLPKAIQTTAEVEEHTFRCRSYASEHTRRLCAEDFPS
jgi:hypothetical protein